MKLASVGLLSALLLLPCATTFADEAPKRDVASLLFENPDWKEAPAGSTITYDYSRDAHGSPDYGATFDDTIKLTLEAGEDAANRKVDVAMFSGTRKIPAGPFANVSTNPVLLLVFENQVQELSRLFQANPRYLKNAIRKAWREAAQIEDVSLSVGGKTVPGTRITTHPFLNDPMKDLMKGLDTLTYVIDVADSVPGEIVAIDIHAPADGAPKFSETLRYTPEKIP